MLIIYSQLSLNDERIEEDIVFMPLYWVGLERGIVYSSNDATEVIQFAVDMLSNKLKVIK